LDRGRSGRRVPDRLHHAAPGRLHPPGRGGSRRDTERGPGTARARYAAFARAAQTQGATSAKAITNLINTGSVAFHQRPGFTTREVPGYNGAGQAMVVRAGPIPLGPAS
jgi:hypothetical protein